MNLTRVPAQSLELEPQVSVMTRLEFEMTAASAYQGQKLLFHFRVGSVPARANKVRGIVGVAAALVLGFLWIGAQWPRHLDLRRRSLAFQF